MFIKAPDIQEFAGQPSWVIRNDQVELAVTQLGAQMAPVTFYRSDCSPVAPYYISPWQGENLPLSDCPVLVPLRGNFFCLPFGGNGTTYNGEIHPPHGETAGSPWALDPVIVDGPVSEGSSVMAKARCQRVTQPLQRWL